MELTDIKQFPPKTYAYFLSYLDEAFLQEFWTELLESLVLEQPLNTTYWISIAENPTAMENLLYTLSVKGHIKTRIDNGYATTILNEENIEITKTQLSQFRAEYKFNRYLLSNDYNTFFDKTRSNKKIIRVGLERKGFKKASNHILTLDTKYLSMFQNEIAKDLYKGLAASQKDVTYQDCIDAILIYLKNSNHQFNLGETISDSRGRAIFQCMRKIFNPISAKTCRALIKCPSYPLHEDGEIFVYAFISELNKYMGLNFRDKVDKGYAFYKRKYISDNADIHERIWLTRIYDKLDVVNQSGNRDWDIPIELDCRASAIQHMGILMNCHLYMDETNLINDNEFKDFWTIKGLSRKMVKKAATPLIYGSSQRPKDLWVKAGLEFTDEQVNLMNNEIRQGKLTQAELFKTFIINKCKPEPIESIKIWNEEFLVYCNRFIETESVVFYKVYNTNTKLITRLRRKEYKTLDLERFKNYHVTLLIHNLDSQVSNYISDKLQWCIPIHDAWNIHPNEAIYLGNVYTKIMYKIYQDRKNILSGYFKSIGIESNIDLDVDREEVPFFSRHALK